MHPLLKSKKSEIRLVLLEVSVILAVWLLMFRYSDGHALTTFLDSVVSVGVFSILAIWVWDAVRIVRSNYFLVALSVVVLLVWSLVIQMVWWLLRYSDLPGYDSYVYSVPLRLFTALSAWCAMMLWYRLAIERQDIENERLGESESVAVAAELCDHVAVKDGARIHIVRLDDLVAIQAEGDYVVLITPDARFVKEQTMKYFELHLPQNRFVRIHRSHIVNVEQILRVELYGKETYHVLLKNGVCLKASSKGYKLLKDRLSL